MMNEKDHFVNDIKTIFYVCVPVYKLERYLDSCIQSVLNQTFGNFQLILVDDGSPDHCGEICDRYAATDDRIIVIHQINQGLVMARQAALRLIQTHIAQEQMERTYIVFLDSDDTLKETALEVINNKIRETSCDMLIYGADLVQDGKFIRSFQGKIPDYEGTVTDKAVLYRIVFGNSCYNTLWRKTVSACLVLNREYIQYAHIQHGEDLLQSLAYYRNARKVVFIVESLYNYTINPDSITQNIQYESYPVDSTVRAMVLKLLQEENVWSQDEYENYFRYCRELLFQEVIIRANFRTTQNNKIMQFDQIVSDPYYRRLLESGDNRKCILNNLRQKKYRWTILQAQIYSFLRFLYKYVFRRKK